MKNVDIVFERYEAGFSTGNKLGRLLWNVVWFCFFRPSPTPFFFWRRSILRIFGASIGTEVHVYPSTRIWAPWNLTMQPHSCLGPGVDCYCVAPVHIGACAIVSQRTFICTADHDISSQSFGLKVAPIHIGANAWIGAESFIRAGVSIGDGAVAGARAVVVRNVEPWSVVAGNPAREIKRREIMVAESSESP